MNTKARLLELADTICHKACDWYINAEVFGRHAPGWGQVQLWQWHLCNAYERAADMAPAAPVPPTHTTTTEDQP
jgi:hypothetical protein